MVAVACEIGRFSYIISHIVAQERGKNETFGVLGIVYAMLAPILGSRAGWVNLAYNKILIDTQFLHVKPLTETLSH